jgi:ribose transport system ATP-binding protein
MTYEISAIDLHKRFGETKALDGCTLRASLGEIHAIVGENGSGKSTLAKIISGVHVPDSGSVSVLNSHPTNPYKARKLGIATIFQEVLVADEASVIDNLFAGADRLFRSAMSASEKHQVAQTLMKRLVGAPVNVDRNVGDMPLSVKQWIVIGRGLIWKPKLLILDESSAALDLDATSRLHDEMRTLRDEGSCIIIVTHRIAELVKIADCATVLRDGRSAGVLEKADITENNLLELMCAKNTGGTVHTLRKRAAAAVVLKTEKLRLTEKATGIDFSLESGEIVGVTGLDGQGQDTFIRVLAGLQQMSSGSLKVVDGSSNLTSVKSLSDAEEQKIGYVSGDRKREGIFPNLSIFENFAIGLYKRNRSVGGWLNRGPLLEKFREEMKALSLKFGDKIDKITTLSGGNQQKVLIGRAMAAQPRILVLNDPVRGVDIGTKQDLYDLLRQFTARGGAVIYLSAELEEFFGFADRVLVFRDDGVFATIGGNSICEESILPAMFGQTGHVEFDAEERDLVSIRTGGIS